MQKTFAKELEISASSLCDAESGNIKPRFELIFSIIEKYNVSIPYLLHGTGDMFIPEPDDALPEPGLLEKHRDWFKKFFHYFEKSPMVRYAVMSFFLSYIYENEKLIEMDMEKSEKEAMDQK